MTTMTSDDCSRLGPFLADYASYMLGCGATCIRIEKNVRRIAARFGCEVDVMVLPAHVELSVTAVGGGVGSVFVRRTARCGINFSMNASLSRLSWDIADGKCALGRAVERFGEIVSTPATPRIEVLLLASVANASFCRLFGGDAVAMAIVMLSTMVGMSLKQIMCGRGCDLRVAVFCAAFFSAALSAAGCIFNLGTTPRTALAVSVLYLIPGVPYINAVSDVIDRHYLCALSRLLDATVITVCLSLGLTAAIYILQL